MGLITEQGYTIAEAARNLGTHPIMLGWWKQELGEKGNDAFPGTVHMAPEQEELRRLRKENERPRMEREKKTTAFFTRGSD